MLIAEQKSSFAVVSSKTSCPNSKLDTPFSNQFTQWPSSAPTPPPPVKNGFIKNSELEVKDEVSLKPHVQGSPRLSQPPTRSCLWNHSALSLLLLLL